MKSRNMHVTPWRSSCMKGMSVTFKNMHRHGGRKQAFNGRCMCVLTCLFFCRFFKLFIRFRVWPRIFERRRIFLKQIRKFNLKDVSWTNHHLPRKKKNMMNASWWRHYCFVHLCQWPGINHWPSPTEFKQAKRKDSIEASGFEHV